MNLGGKIAIGAIALGVTGISIYLYNQYKKLINGAFKVTGVKNIDLTGGQIKLTLLTSFTNNGDLSAKLTDQSYDVFINNTKVSTVDNKEQITVGSKGTSVIPLNVNIDTSTLLKTGLANVGLLISDPSKVNLKIKGKMSWKAGILNGTQPFDINYTVKQLLASKNQTSTTATT